MLPGAGVDRTVACSATPLRITAFEALEVAGVSSGVCPCFFSHFASLPAGVVFAGTLQTSEHGGPSAASS